MRRIPLPSAVLLTALAVLLTSCSRSPVAPEPTTAPGAGSMAGIHVPDPPAPIEGGPGATSSVFLKVGDEATLTAGRFTLFLHKNALTHDATVTMFVRTPDATEVEFTVTPSASNDFQVPAHVIADFTDMPSLDLSNQSMYYWDAAWDVPEVMWVDATTRTVNADLHILSNCKVDQVSKNKNHFTE